ncbi:MAG: ATP-binding protein [Bacteroidales bacterium]
MSSDTFVLYIILLMASLTGALWSGLKGTYSVMTLSISVLLFSIYKLISLYLKTYQKVHFLLKAIKNSDYTFKFAENVSGRNDRFLNYALNEIRQILSDAKVRAIEKEKYYELILNSVKTGVVTINSAGNVYQTNKEGLRVIGLEVFTNINQLSVISEPLRDAFASIKAGEKKNVVVTNEFGEKNISMMASEINVDGVPMTIIALTDINSELAEKELESWIRLIRVLTHEIMNSLAPVTSLSGSLMDICDDKQSDMARGLATINSTSKGLISFVESYRKFTHIPVPNKKALYIKELLERVVALEEETAAMTYKAEYSEISSGAGTSRETDSEGSRVNGLDSSRMTNAKVIRGAAHGDSRETGSDAIHDTLPQANCSVTDSDGSRVTGPQVIRVATYDEINDTVSDENRGTIPQVLHETDFEGSRVNGLDGSRVNGSGASQETGPQVNGGAAYGDSRETGSDAIHDTLPQANCSVTDSDGSRRCIIPSISLSVIPDDILVYADEDLISQVAINIVKNALQACLNVPEGHIRIEARLDENENTVIDISNNGGAIPKDIAENIFLPFFTTKEAGSGIGLSLSKQIMRLHEGSLYLSCNTDERVTFTLVLT